MNRIRYFSYGAACLLCIPLAIAQNDALLPSPDSPIALTPEIHRVVVPVSAVTVYRGRASVTREAALNLQPGAYDLQFLHLPETVQPDSLQARASRGMKILNVEYEEIYIGEAASPQIAELDSRIETLEEEFKALGRKISLSELQEKFINRVSIRASTDAGDKGGTEALDLDAVRQQYAFLKEEWESIINERFDLEAKQAGVGEQMKVLRVKRSALAGESRTDRVATVSVVVLTPGEMTVDLIYLVHSATWQPKYNIRAAADGGTITIEYDAVLSQRTGEDWNQVSLTLSTARPTIAANPPKLTPWYVDVATPVAVGLPPTSAAPMRRMDQSRKMDRAYFGDDAVIMGNYREEEDKYAYLGRAARQAEVGGEGPSVTFALPRLVTVETNAKKQQRTRITTIRATPEYVHIAVPLLTESVYVLARVQNTGEYQLLLGPAAVFAGQDYIGPTLLPAVAPHAQLKVFFGIDEAVKAKRTLVKKSTGKTGLLGGGRRTSYNIRLDLDNGTGKDIAVELWDRMPVSRHEKIVINLVKPSRPLATDKEYADQQKPQGLLKWILHIPTGSTGKSAFALTYGVEVDRAKEIEMTPLPE